jgi:short-subunit dehydrogenase
MFWAARAVGRRMVARGAGKVINVGSMLGERPRPNTAA